MAADAAPVWDKQQKLHDFVHEIPVVRRTDIGDATLRAYFSVS
jgi:hypothetical protein